MHYSICYDTYVTLFSRCYQDFLLDTTRWKEATLHVKFAGILYIQKLLGEQRTSSSRSNATGWVYDGTLILPGKNWAESTLAIAMAIYGLEEQAYEGFVNSLKLAVYALRKTPIVSDARKYSLSSPPAPRQIADLEREVAKQLVHLGRYCAKVRLSQAEYTI